MTGPEFTTEFERLCKGFKQDPTQEQAEAWYRRIGHTTLPAWSEAVTTLLCGKYFPKLEEALDVIEREMEAYRRQSVQTDKAQAKKTYVLTQTGAFPWINSLYFRAVRAYAGRQAARRHLETTVPKWERDGKKPHEIRYWREFWEASERGCEQVLLEVSPQLTPEENRSLMKQYEGA